MKTAFVIGSGIAGLSISEILSRNGWKVVLLESQDKIGGEASLATQKWYHTGWLYASLPNPSAMLGCYKALNLYRKVYGNIIPSRDLNISNANGLVYYPKSDSGWFIDEKIQYYFALSTFEMSLPLKLFWPSYLRLRTFKRLRKLNYDTSSIENVDLSVKQLLNTWEKSDNGFKRYEVVSSTDAKIDTDKVMRSLVQILSGDTEIITKACFALSELNGRSTIKIDKTVHKPDLIVIASGKTLPDHLRDIGAYKAADMIKSIKSPILVLEEELPYPDFIRFTPKINHTINHIKYTIPNHGRVSTVGSYYSFPVDASPDITIPIEEMCKLLDISSDVIVGSYYGIKTEFTGNLDRRYNHAIEKVNHNTYFALAGKFSQFPLLVYDFINKADLSLGIKYNSRIQIDPAILSQSYPEQILRNVGIVKNEDCFLS